MEYKIKGGMPGMPQVPPAMPMMTLSFTASGATVMEWPVLLSATTVSQRTAPVLASSATRWASTVPM